MLIVYPRITIITPSYNQCEYLEQTIVSVIEQNYPNLEYIIIDGGSTDKSVDIIKKYQKHLSYWISEKDNGQSHAINKGLEKISGDIFNWLNSDDYLEKDALHIIGEVFASKQGLHCFIGELNIIKNGESRKDNKYIDCSTFESAFISPRIKQPSTFYSTEVIKQLGMLDEHLHFCMDLDLWYRFIVNFGTKNIFESNQTIANFRVHEDSKSVSQSAEFFNDRATIFHSMLTQKGETKASLFLRNNFNIRTGHSFDAENNNLDVELILRATAYFLLNDFKNIYNKQDFEMAVKIKTLFTDLHINLTCNDAVILKKMIADTIENNWMFYRMRRKWKHIFLIR